MESEIKRVLAVHNDPTAAAQARARLLAPEQQLQQRALRKSFTRMEKTLKEAEYKATMFKAKLASRDRHRSSRKLQPPTVEAVRTTIMKLTAMAEKKNRDVELLEERMRRLRLGGRRADRSLSSITFGSFTPEPQTPSRIMTPGMNSMNSSLVGFTPVMALVEEGEIEEAVEERRRRREAGRKLKGALQKMREAANA
jgi:nucleoporin NUP159